MKRYYLIFGVIISCFLAQNAHSQVGVGTTSPDQSAVLEVESHNKGFLPPRMTANQRLSISNPAEGLVVFCTDCCNNGGLNFFNGSKWIGFNACLGLGLDSDNDGVINSIDLDDDNDGILDIDEGANSYSTSNPTAFTQVSGTGINTDVHVNDVYLYEDYLTINSLNYDMRAEILELSLDTNSSGRFSIRMKETGVPILSYFDLEASLNNFYRIEFSFIEANSISLANPKGILANIPNGSAIIADIESSNGKNVSEIGGIGRARLLTNAIQPNSILNVDIDPTSEINGSFWSSTTATDNLSDFTLVTMRKDLAGNVNDWTDESTISNSSSRPHVEFKYDAFSSIEMIFGVTGSEYGAQQRGMSFVIGSLFNKNSDNSGLENYLDNDSDDDGCFDALEGDGGFTLADVNSAGQLLGPVGANGVPIIAGGGQNVGSSENPNVCP